MTLPNLKNTNFALTSNSQTLVVCGPFSEALKHLWPFALNIAPNVKDKKDHAFKTVFDFFIFVPEVK